MARRLPGWFRHAAAGGAVALLTVAPAPAADGVVPASFRHRLPADDARRIEPAVASATRRLGESECGRLLEDFADEQGRPLLSRIDELGLDREAYLGLIVYEDGRHAETCQRRDVLALTSPGGRVVAVCPAFYRTLRDDPRLAEDVLIHEMLHTLGLGENPPSSREINRRVFERCGR